MVLKSNISITQFLFTLEELLLENLVISHRRELEWHIVEYYKNIVIRDLPASFQLDKKQFLSFKKNYNQRRRIFEKYKQPGDLDPLKVLLRQARDAASTPQTGALHQTSRPPRRRRLARRTRQWNRLALDLRPSSLRAMLNVLRARCPCKHPST